MKRDNKERTNTKIERAKALKRAGYSIKQISETLDIKASTVRRLEV